MLEFIVIDLYQPLTPDDPSQLLAIEARSLFGNQPWSGA